MTFRTFMTTIALATGLMAAGCSLPWKRDKIANEVNLAFILRNNLIELVSLEVDGSRGRYILGSATLRTVVDPSLPGSSQRVLTLGERRSVRVSPEVLELGAAGDAIIGADAWSNHTLTIDYRAGLATLQHGGIQRWEMQLYRYPAEPMIEVLVDGRTLVAVVDTASPDTLILPGPEPRRGVAGVVVGGVDFGQIDVRYAPVAQARIGNRLLSHFLVSIDYGRRLVGLWRDPRIPRESERQPVAAGI